MTLLKTLGAAAFAAALFAAVPAAGQTPPPEFTIDTAGWKGGAQVQDGRFLSCSVSRRYDNGVGLVVGMNGRYDMNIGLVNPQWTLAEGEQATARVQIDGSYDKSFPAMPAGPQVLVMATGQDQQLYDQLRAGSVLTVTIGEDRYEFPLTGTSASLAAMRACVDRARQMAGQPTGGQGQRQRGGITAEQLAGLLEQAGVEDVKFVRPDDLPPGLAQGWVVGDDVLLGGVVQKPRQSADVRLDAFAEEFSQAVAENCPVPLEREEQPAEIIGERYGVKTATLRCTGGESPMAMAVLYTLDDYQYSAFFHEAAPESEQAAVDATTGLATVIRGMAEGAATRRNGAGQPAAPAEPAAPEQPAQ